MAAKQYLVCFGQGAGKFWEAWREDNVIYTRSGKIGMQGQTKVQNKPTPEAAKTSLEEMVKAKRAEGYFDSGDAASEATQSAKEARKAEASEAKRRRAEEKARAAEEAKQHAALRAEQRAAGGAPGKAARDAALEKQILANPHDEDAFAIYADWLQMQGDIRGELAAIQARLAKRPKDKKLARAEATLVTKHRDYFYGPLGEYLPNVPVRSYDRAPIVVTWRHGWMDSLALAAVPSYVAPDLGIPTISNVADLVRVLPDVESARFLRELTIATPLAEDRFDFRAPVKALAKVLPKLPLVRRLTIGDFTQEESELSWSDVGPLDALWPQAHALEYLKIRGHSFGKIKAPNLRELRIESSGLTKENVRAIAKARWPHLHTLSLWFGDDNYGCDCTVRDAASVLDIDAPKLRHLALANTQFGDKLVEHVVKSKLLGKLETLDLSMSHITSAGVEAMAKHEKAFAHLAKLDLSECIIDKAGQILAKKILKTVDVSKQADPDAYYEDDDYYCAIGE